MAGSARTRFIIAVIARDCKASPAKGRLLEEPEGFYYASGKPSHRKRSPLPSQGGLKAPSSE